MKIGILGGSGLYEMESLVDTQEIEVSTPFGLPSDRYIYGKINESEIYFLPRHGRGHKLMPSEINYRANIFGFKKLGVSHILSISAVGSLRETFRPCDIVIPDQYYDRTKSSDHHTFFGRGIVAHIPFADPTCHTLGTLIANAVRTAIKTHAHGRDMQLHVGGTYVNMEGPAFSTKAESNAYRKMGFDIIGMTSLAEAKLCREAEICYACMAMVTDYDCWHSSAESVTVDMVIKNLQSNIGFAKAAIQTLAQTLPANQDCTCHHSLKNAIITSPSSIPDHIKRELQPIIGKYYPAG